MKIGLLAVVCRGHGHIHLPLVFPEELKSDGPTSCFDLFPSCVRRKADDDDGHDGDDGHDDHGAVRVSLYITLSFIRLF